MTLQTNTQEAGPSSIAGAIDAEGGRVTFARFMQLALTHPTLGYYSRVGRLLGRRGDFTTAPAVSPFFCRTVARLVTELIDAALTTTGPARRPAGRPSLVELGGGEGHLAREILALWEGERPGFRGKVSYRIVELGSRLEENQAAAVKVSANAGWDLGWGATLEEACAGTSPVVIIGNEFLDTLPVHLVGAMGGAIREVYVETGLAGLVEVWGSVSDAAAAEVELLFGTLDPVRLEAHTEDGTLEVFPSLGSLMAGVGKIMPAGSLVNIDYGEWFPGPPHAGPAKQLEGRGRRRRTVRGYFKHQMVVDPLVRAGRQDLTADVDFSAVDLHGRAAGFETVLFTTLATFLRGGGAEAELQRLAAAEDALESGIQATALESLLDTEDLGDVFKVMVQVKE